MHNINITTMDTDLLLQAVIEASQASQAANETNAMYSFMAYIFWLLLVVALVLSIFALVKHLFVK